MTKASSIKHLEEWLAQANQSMKDQTGGEREYWHQRSHTLLEELDRLYALENEIRCQQQDCTTKPGDADVYEVPNDCHGITLFDYYCSAHATRAGYCVGCGGFYGGIESFELEGMCENCMEDLAEDDDDSGTEYDPGETW